MLLPKAGERFFEEGLNFNNQKIDIRNFKDYYVLENLIIVVNGCNRFDKTIIGPISPNAQIYSNRRVDKSLELDGEMTEFVLKNLENRHHSEIKGGSWIYYTLLRGKGVGRMPFLFQVRDGERKSKLFAVNIKWYDCQQDPLYKHKYDNALIDVYCLIDASRFQIRLPIKNHGKKRERSEETVINEKKVVSNMEIMEFAKKLYALAFLDIETELCYIEYGKDLIQLPKEVTLGSKFEMLPDSAREFLENLSTRYL